MKDTSPKIRIKDIATLAGVSEGTVDRVLHKRGDVSQKSLDAVNKILEEINYTPNLIARSLASKKQYKFVCLFPQFQHGEYWQSVDNGFDIAAQEFIHHNVHIEKRFFDQFDVESFIQVSRSICEENMDAVIMAPIFKDECLVFIKQLRELNIPFSFIDSMIEDSDFVTYYGQNSFQSGSIAAKLLFNSIAPNEKMLVIRTQRKGAVSNQTLNRYNGFNQYLNDKKSTKVIELIHVEFKDDDENSNLEVLREVFKNHQNIGAAITFNSKVYRLAMHLETLKIKNVKLIGYDLLEQNVAYLKQDVISYLIAQRPDKQAYYTVNDLCKKLIFKQEFQNINFMPIDLLIKENIEYYLGFKE